MSSINDLRVAITDMIGYLTQHEEEDFVEQIERFESDDTKPSQHVFLAAFVAHNALLESEGKETDTLGQWLCHDFDNERPLTYFQCQDTEFCGYIGTVTEPIQDGLILTLDYNEPIPAGVCPYCASIVRAV